MDPTISPPDRPLMAGRVTVDLSAITDNVRTLRAISRAPHFMAVVKGNAYGHGLVEVGRTAVAAGADWLGTAQLTEAIALRRAGIKAPILAWLYLASETSAAISEAFETDIDLSAGSADQIRILSKVAHDAGRTGMVHLELDSGLSRGGARSEEWPELVAAAVEAEASGALKVRGIWTHLAWADVPAHPENDLAVANFEAAVQIARQKGLDPQLRHVASSANILARPDRHFDMVRAGLAVYGLSPAEHLHAEGFGLRPALTATAPIVMLKRVPAGAGVSYEHRVITHEPRYLGLIPLGYADGIPRAITGHSLVRVRGRAVRIVGTVCMDQFMVDLGTSLGDVTVGEPAVLFGDPVAGVASADDWGAAIGSHGDEIINQIAPRMPRSYRMGPQPAGA